MAQQLMPTEQDRHTRSLRFLSQNRPGPRMGMGHYERLLIQSLMRNKGQAEWKFDIRFPGRKPKEGLSASALDPGLTSGAFEGYSLNRLTGLPWPIARAAITLSQSQSAPDLYHSLSLAYPAPSNAPAVYTIHDLPPARFDDEGTVARWAKSAAKSARVIMTPSQFAKNELIELLGLSEAMFEVIPYGCEHEIFHPDVLPADAQARIRLGIEGPYLLYAGGFTRRKNVRALLEAWKMLAPQYPDLTLALAGPAEPLRAFVSETNAPHVAVLGYIGRDILPSLLKSATALVCPSIYEGFGLPPLEALAVGVPVVAVRAGAIPEVVGERAIFAPDGSAESLAEAICSLLDDPEQAKALAKDGPARAALFQWDEHARRVLGVYSKAIAK